MLKWDYSKVPTKEELAELEKIKEKIKDQTRINLPKYDEEYEETLKKQLFEQTTVVEDMRLPDDKWAHHERPGEEWDVPLREEIQYFDPELSYELTGYRPITMEKGLDFDPAPFQEVGEIFERTGKYTEYPVGGKLHRKFWDEQTDRCVNGYTVGKYRITGVHYFFLNFYRMRTVKNMKGVGAGRTEAFPLFHAEQYKWYHYREMCAILKRDSVALKGRGVN